MEISALKYMFLLIVKTADVQWSLVLQQALSPLGELCIVPEEEVAQAITQRQYDVIVIDAGAVQDAALLTFDLKRQCPEARVIVTTTSPTWRRAREAFKAGAADYVRKSLDGKELRSKVKAVLEFSSPS
jgi:DNA-binding NtrC family response regulator